MPIIDGHLDLAENVTLFGLDLTAGIAERRARERRVTQQATVSLPEMARGGIAVAFATVTPGFLTSDVGDDFEPRSALYRTPQDAEAHALTQIDLYERWERQGHVRIIKSLNDLEDHLQLWGEDSRPGLVLLMESADAIVQVSDLPRWRQRGLRMIGLTYGDTKYAAGVASGKPAPFPARGGLTAEGRALLESMAGLGLIWDISHLAEDGVWQGLGMNFPHVCASHANARALTPSDRQLSDEVIRALGERNGVIGVVLYNAFLEPRWRRDKTIRVTLSEHLARHATHIAAIAGWDCVGIGSDLDGGLGLEESPVEIDTIADLHKIGAVVPPEAREAVLGVNWLNFLRRALPRAA